MAERIGKHAFTDYFEESSQKHIVLDCSILDLEERKRKAVILDNAEQVAAYLNVKIDTVFRNRIPSPKTKRITGINGKEYAVRLYKEPLTNP
jgi:hypothetical protein